ncbi:leucine-rich repeat-containing protein, partial [Tanacetum coccineum]
MDISTCVPIKINVLAWKIKTDALPTRFNISRRGIDIQDMSCPICDNAIESTDHLFFRCGLVRDIANKVLSWWNLDHANLNSYAEWKSWLVSIRMDSKLKKMFEGVWYSIWWYVWIYRNKLLFDERKPSKSMLIDNVIASSFYWLAVGATHTCIDKERQALLDFKAPLQDPRNVLSTWRPEDEDDCCQWSGVTCNNRTGHVTELYLNDYGLGGEISLSLLNLTYLNHLDLYGNSFHGTIPKSIGNMTHLTYLSLAYNKFTGTIPESIGNMTQLTELYLFENNFNGTIPISIGSLTSLTILDLFENKFSGVIPKSLGSLTKLRDLYLGSNKFCGNIPREFGNLTNLEVLDLDSLRSCRVENLDWLSSLSSLEVLTM